MTNMYDKKDALDFVLFMDENLNSVKIEDDTYVTDHIPEESTWLFVAGHYDKFMNKVLFKFLLRHYYESASKRLFDVKKEELPLYLNPTKKEIMEDAGTHMLNKNLLEWHLIFLTELIKWRLKKGK